MKPRIYLSPALAALLALSSTNVQAQAPNETRPASPTVTSAPGGTTNVHDDHDDGFDDWGLLGLLGLLGLAGLRRHRHEEREIVGGPGRRNP